MIKKIKIPENMKTIGQSVFEPSTLKEIVFEDGSKLENNFRPHKRFHPSFFIIFVRKYLFILFFILRLSKAPN